MNRAKEDPSHLQELQPPHTNIFQSRTLSRVPPPFPFPLSTTFASVSAGSAVTLAILSLSWAVIRLYLEVWSHWLIMPGVVLVLYFTVCSISLHSFPPSFSFFLKIGSRCIAQASLKRMKSSPSFFLKIGSCYIAQANLKRMKSSFFLKIGSRYIAQASLKRMNHRYQLPQCSDYRLEPPWLALYFSSPWLFCCMVRVKKLLSLLQKIGFECLVAGALLTPQ